MEGQYYTIITFYLKNIEARQTTRITTTSNVSDKSLKALRGSFSSLIFLVERAKSLLSADSMSASVSVRLSILLITVNGPTFT